MAFIPGLPCHFSLRQKTGPPVVCASSPRRRVRVVANGASAASTPQEPEFSTAASSRSPSPPEDWKRVSSCEVLLPAKPQLVLYFVGGLGAGTAPKSFYSKLLVEVSAMANAAVVAYRLPIIPSTDHTSLSKEAALAFSVVLERYPDLEKLPAFGMGHSLGSKLLLLGGIDEQSRSSMNLTANVFIAFNNSQLREAIPFPGDTDIDGEQIASTLESSLDSLDSFLSGVSPGSAQSISGAKKTVVKFIRNIGSAVNSEIRPDPREVLSMAAAKYSVSRNLIIRFQKDDIDDSEELVKVLRSRFGQRRVINRVIDGSHVTPITPDFGSGAFTSVGNPEWDEMIKATAAGVNKELDQCVAVIAAFLRLHLEMMST